MFKFLINYNAESDAYSLTQSGGICIVVLLVVLLVAAAFLFNRNHSAKLSTKQLVFSATSIAIAFILSFVKIVPLPWGGSVTLFSMFFVCIVGYFYGPNAGLMAALAYGLLQLLQDGGSYMIHPFQICCDYIFSFMALGLSGFFINKKHGLLIGYVVGILGRLVFLTLGGYIFWMSYMPENFPVVLSTVYPIIYNASYILTEGLFTIILLCIPAVTNGISHIKKIATS